MQNPVVVGQRVAGPQGAPRGVVLARAVQAAPVQPRPDESRRLNHKKLHVTLAALGVDEVANEQVLLMAQARGTLVEWSIGDELHATPADPNRPRHKHFYLHYMNPVNHRDARYCTYFDMIGLGGRGLHPHIQGVGHKREDRAAVIYYTQKDKLYISSLNLRNFDAESTSARWSIEMNQVESVEEGMRHICESGIQRCTTCTRHAYGLDSRCASARVNRARILSPTSPSQLSRLSSWRRRQL